MAFLIIVILGIGLYFYVVIQENKKFSLEAQKNKKTINELYSKIRFITDKNKQLAESNRNLIRENEIKKIKLQNDFRLQEIEALNKQKLLDMEIKKELSNYKLNKTMLNVFEEYTDKRLNGAINYFTFKKRPSLKSAEYIREIKDEYKQLERENKELKLIVSQFISEEETIEKDENNTFDTEEKAYRYGKISKEKWQKLSYIEKLDIVIEKYKNSWKDKLNIGLEFERYCGYTFEKAGFKVKYWGILNGKKDGGIDLVAKKKEKTLYIQCKYWGNNKTIRENTISQLFGASLKMAIDEGENYESFIKKVKSKKIEMVLLTKTELSIEAKEFCKKLDIIYFENIEIEDYPRVKLVGGTEKIFYIPTDLQYDNIVFNSTNKEYKRVTSCKEADILGYRHCFKWRGNI